MLTKLKKRGLKSFEKKEVSPTGKSGLGERIALDMLCTGKVQLYIYSMQKKLALESV
jgi:hypothetical protein